MARRRFYVPAQSISGDTAILPPEQAHHLRDVLRLTAGDPVELFDGEGNGYSGVVTESSRVVQIGGLMRLTTPLLLQPRLILAAALIRSDRFEWMLQKATELGADEFVPLRTLFTSVRIPEQRLEGRLHRWQRIVTEAARQCGRKDVPAVQRPVDFSRFLEAERTALPARFLFSEGAEALLIPGYGDSPGAVLCVGPEGGWDQSEVEGAESAGFRAFSLGQSILRSETAAIAAVTLFRFHAASAIASNHSLSNPSCG